MSSLKVECPQCCREYTIDSKLAGQKLICANKTCGAKFIAEDGQASTEAVAAAVSRRHRKPVPRLVLVAAVPGALLLVGLLVWLGLHVSGFFERQAEANAYRASAKAFLADGKRLVAAWPDSPETVSLLYHKMTADFQKIPDLPTHQKLYEHRKQLRAIGMDLVDFLVFIDHRTAMEAMIRDHLMSDNPAIRNLGKVESDTQKADIENLNVVIRDVARLIENAELELSGRSAASKPSTLVRVENETPRTTHDVEIGKQNNTNIPNDSENQHTLQTENPVEDSSERKDDTEKKRQDAIEATKQLNALREKTAQARAQYENDKQLLSDARAYVGGLREDVRTIAKRLEEKRTQGKNWEQWEIEFGSIIAPPGTKLYTFLREQAKGRLDLPEWDTVVAKNPTPDYYDIRYKLQILLDRISTAKSALKVATISNSQIGIAAETKKIKALQNSLRKIVNPQSAKLQSNELEVGQIGGLPLKMFRAFVISQNGLENLYLWKFGKDQKQTVFVELIGLEPIRLEAATIELNPNEEFKVVAEFKFDGQVGGKTQNAYRLQLTEQENKTLLTEGELFIAQKALDEDFDLGITEVEHANAVTKEQERDRDAKSRRSRALLDLGKQLLKKENNSAARKQLEKAVAESPDSESGKEAAKLLKDLR